MKTLLTHLARLATTLLLAAAAHAQVDKPVRILVGFAPGGSADIAARMLAERMAGELKQPVLVENKPGAGARIAAEMLKNAAPDGSTLMLAPIVVPVLAPLVFSKLPYNPNTDFAPVVHVANFQFGLSVNANHPAKNMQELVAWYKANPAQANFGSPAPGSLPHFFGVMISSGAGLDLIHVPFNGGGPLMNALRRQPGQLGHRHRGGPDRDGPRRQDPYAGHLGRHTQPAAARGAHLRRGRAARRGRHELVRRLCPSQDAGRHDSATQRRIQQGPGHT